jgi:hypothetical protein
VDRARTLGAGSRLNMPAGREPDVAIPLVPRPGASLHERIVDALSRILLETHDALVIMDEPNAEALRWIEPHLQQVFDQVNSVMLQITD